MREALVFLNQWPKARRGPVFSCAVRSSNAAIAGQMTPEQARQALWDLPGLPGVLAKSDFVVGGD
ncbi:MULTISPECIES: DUF982 domain-containing protein [unclassified Mesorhizobium]|uniref:DUF982 domain-containing protein n=1 Tax=unclassified Mesorhizobium TaxID=325217 RepID=UPI001FDF402B|nr:MULTISPECIES: DUF982 domain-containing protein [unclassified Mesorhizobium]MDF3152977.1 DUF982 domain-containing protein [Mesorhizobium sp. XAP10]MDF3245013.1 DUF982 domain-containing protein [Mesorhizobium sp. XAP4]